LDSFPDGERISHLDKPPKEKDTLGYGTTPGQLRQIYQSATSFIERKRTNHQFKPKYL
jgi:hypothetical protein